MMKKRIITWVLFLMLIMAEICPVKIQGAVQPAPEISAPGAVLMEPSTGTVLYEKNGEEQRSPASITKIMTLLLIFEALEDGQITLEEEVVTSAYAKSMGGSQVFLEEGEKQTVETLIKCIVVASGNDASVAMAEHISGSEEEFVKEMNKRAKNLGMKHTHFEDCCGLTDSDNHYTSAMDVAIMSRELIVKYPEIFKYSTIWMESFTHKTNKGESEFMLTNTNKLLKNNRYVKGLKTGSTSKAKYCVSTVAEKDGVELIAVVMAAPDYKARFVQSNSLINYGFSNCKVYKDNKKYQNKVNICGGEKDKVKVQNDTFSYVDTKGGKIDGIESKVALKDNINAPVRKGDIVGKIEYIMDKKKIGEVKIMAEETVDKADYGFTFLKLVKYMFQIT